MAAQPPHITLMTWSTATEVLPHEAHDFTPWLAGNLELLAEPLGLDELTLVATEWKVDAFALDILAQGRDADGSVTVVIENQYGSTDHRHLGQLLTYAAHAAAGGGRVLAVWITEEVRPAHLAAVDFVNRVAAADDATFGIVLMRMRFAAAPGGWYVHFETDSEPNAFLAAKNSGGGGGGGSTTTMAARGDFIDAVTQLLDPALHSLGMRRAGEVNRRHGAVKYRLPLGIELGEFATARVICTRDATNVALYIEDLPTAEENSAIADILRAHAEPHLDGVGLQVDDWHGSKEGIKRDRVISQLPIGYLTGTPQEVAEGAEQVFKAWCTLLNEDPLMGIAARVQTALQTS